MIDDGHSQPAPQFATTATPRVMLKFEDSVDIPYRDDVEDEIDSRGIGPWRDLASRFPGIQLRRLFTTLEPDQLQSLVDRAKRNDPAYRPPNFFTCFVVDCPSGVETDAVAAALRGWPSVESAYPAPEAALPAFVTSDPSIQGYHSPAPDGIDAFYAWEIDGSDGANQTIVDMEVGWTLNHPDLGLDTRTSILGTVPSNPIYAGHGTAVLGVICALDNGVESVGIAPKATVKVVSSADPITLLQDTAHIPDAITTALLSLTFGNVLLLEAQVQATVLGVPRYLPCEADSLCLAAIQLASAIGVVVIEPAASNDVDLDAFVDDKGRHAMNVSIASEFQDSGAIVVGGATSAAPHAHLATASGRGSRIDCYGWAENVTTCDANGDGIPDSFSGTSAASAIIAGAVLVIQGMFEKSTTNRFGPAQMRAILRDIANGTPVTPIGGGVATRAIPDLGKIANVLGVAPDVYIRDFLGDTGAATGKSQAMSPDIIVVTADAGDSRTAFGPGSGTEENDLLSEPVLAGQDNFVYVRVRNRGGSDAANVTVTVYWAEPSTLITPDVWTPIGSDVIPNVAADGSLHVTHKIPWLAADIPQPGHYCFVALASHPLDPAPVWANFSAFANPNAWDSFTRFINVNNNVAWRNFDVVPLVAAVSSEPLMRRFWMRGAFDRARPMGLEVVAHLPTGAQATLEVPAQLIELWELPVRHAKIEKGRATIPLVRDGRLRLPPINLPARAKVPMQIQVVIPEDAPDAPCDVYARQMWEGIELGRVTWRFQRQLPNITDPRHRQRTER